MSLNCIICFDDIKLKDLTALSCGHLFHIDCIIQLVKKEQESVHCRERITWTVPQLIKHKELFKTSLMILKILVQKALFLHI